MKTFEIRNGDLVVGPGGFATVTGATKVKQDMAVAMREPYGSDRFHPRWGSLLSTYVGEPLSRDLAQRIESEVHRLMSNYMAVQQDQMTADAAQGRRSRFGSGEVIREVHSVQTRAAFDRLYLRVTFTTLSGESVALTSNLGL